MRREGRKRREKERWIKREKGDITVSNVRKRHTRGNKRMLTSEGPVLSATRPPLRPRAPHKARVPVIVICQDAS